MRNPTLDSAGSALRVVKLFHSRHTLTVTEVSHELGVAKSTAHRLLATLVAEGFAQRDPIKRAYHPGAALVAVGLATMGTLDVQRRANATVADLASRVGETVKMVVLQGRFARCISSIQADQSLRVGGDIGQLLPVHATAAGKVLLMDKSEDDIRRLFPATLPALTPYTISTLDALMVELQRVRQRNWASSEQESALGVFGLAVPIMGMANRLVAALAIAAPTARVTADRRVEMVGELLRAAEAIHANSS